MSFGGTRTYHRMACAIEDAGFEVRDMIEWVYGSGFPKSLSVGKAINKLEIKEWSKIGKALDNIDQESIMEVWKRNSNNVRVVETQSLKNQIIAGQDMPNESFVPVNVAENINQENLNLLVSFAEQNLNEVQAISTKTNTALQSVEAEIRQLQNNVKSAEKQSLDQNLNQSMSIFTAQCDVKEWLNENTEVNHKVDEALKTLRGNKKYSNEEITSVLCAVIPSILKHTILNQSRTFQSLDTNLKTECASAINVIITEYIMEHLILNTVNILKSKAVDKLQGNERTPYERPDFVARSNKKPQRESQVICGEKGKYTKGTSEWEGWGTALKPAHEPICMARKPLSEKTVAENCLKWGTGGINIDESRVESKPRLTGTLDKGEEIKAEPTSFKGSGTRKLQTGYDEKMLESNLGRFPANLIHDNSEEVRECFPSPHGAGSQRQKFIGNTGSKNINLGGGITANRFGDSGNASRFFKSIIYQAKASKSERNKGLDVVEDENKRPQGEAFGDGSAITEHSERKGNFHPTVKPIALMEYLIKMVTPKGGIVLDPFAGSGTTICK